MEPAGGSVDDLRAYTPEIAETLRFEEEIQSLMSAGSPPASGSSFTALLDLPAGSQAMELLHVPAAPWRLPPPDPGPVIALPLAAGCLPTFPSDAALVERAARFSVFASEFGDHRPIASDSGDRSPRRKPKLEPVDLEPPAIDDAAAQRPAKRKEPLRGKANGSASSKKKKNNSSIAEEGNCMPPEELSGGGGGGGSGSGSGDGGEEKKQQQQQLPYVHVRARRGQATDSHSLAERARREKINARMKLLQELVPGCSQITGTALVLDEIINHVQSLQRQVEFLSMRLAAVDPAGIDFAGVDDGFFLSGECGKAGCSTGGVPKRQPQDHHHGFIWHVDLVRQEHQQQRQHHVFINNNSGIPFHPANSVTSHADQLKSEL